LCFSQLQLLDHLGGTKVVEEQVLFQNKFGRIRDVVEGPDGFLYFGTRSLSEIKNTVSHFLANAEGLNCMGNENEGS